MLLWRRVATVVVVMAGSLFVALIADVVAVGADSAWTYAGISGGTPEVIVVVTRDGTLGQWSGSRGGARWTCGYYALAAPQMSVIDPTPLIDWLGGPVNPVAGEYHMMGCVDQDGVRVRTRWVMFEPSDPFSGLAATERAVDEARNRLELPSPRPVVNPRDWQLVGLPMWMWLDDPWERVWASASIGDVWVGVAAWPETSFWEFSDGTSIWCDKGIAYDIFRSPLDQWSGCVHTFTHTSAFNEGGVEWARVTVTWGVEWTSSEVGGEPLGTVTRSTDFAVRVVEAQALVR